MTGKTLADHSRAYRTRKAERIARMEAALKRIAQSEQTAGIYDVLGNARIARDALAEKGNTQ